MIESSVSVIICTRNRGTKVLPAVTSILRNTFEDYELVIVDQSDDDRTHHCLLSMVANSRLRYMRSEELGKGRALNYGISTCKSQLILITDDDCRVPDNWISCMKEAFVRLREPGTIFCRVTAGEFNPLQGHVPVFYPVDERTYLQGGDLNKIELGIGAGMAISRRAFDSIQGFDKELGPGATFAAADEVDFAYRCFLRGFGVAITDRAEVIHDGFRTWDQLTMHTKRDVMGSGAMIGKLARNGSRSFLVSFGRLVMKWLIESARNIARLKRPQGLKRIYWLCDGFLCGWKASVDSETLLFKLSKEDADRLGRRFVKRDV